MRYIIAIIALLWYASAGAQTLTNKGTAVDNSGSGSSLAITGVSVTAPVMIIVGVYEDSTSGGGGVCNSGASISDGSNTYTLLTHIAPSGGSSDGDLCVYYFNYPSVGLTSATITYTYHVSGDNASMSVTAINGYGGVAPDSAVTDTARGNNITSPATVTSGTPTVSGETFIGFSVVVPSTTFTQTAGWTTPPNVMSNTTGTPNTTFQSGNLVGSGMSVHTYAPTFTGTKTWGSIILGIEPPAVSSTCGALMTVGVGC